MGGTVLRRSKASESLTIRLMTLFPVLLPKKRECSSGPERKLKRKEKMWNVNVVPKSDAESRTVIINLTSVLLGT